jgi:hypothetical protein
MEDGLEVVGEQREFLSRGRGIQVVLGDWVLWVLDWQVWRLYWA